MYKKKENKRFSSFPIKNRKKAQIGSTMNWVIATIIIIVILSSSIALSEISKKSRGFIYNEFELNEKYSQKTEKGISLLSTKSLINFLETKNNFQTLQELEEININQEKLGKNITIMKYPFCEGIIFPCKNIISLKGPSILAKWTIYEEMFIKIPLNKNKSIYLLNWGY